MIIIFAERDVAVDLPIIEVLRDLRLARAVGEDNIFVAPGRVLVGELRDNVGADKIGAVNDRHFDDAAHAPF